MNEAQMRIRMAIDAQLNAQNVLLGLEQTKKKLGELQAEAKKTGTDPSKVTIGGLNSEEIKKQQRELQRLLDMHKRLEQLGWNELRLQKEITREQERQSRNQQYASRNAMYASRFGRGGLQGMASGLMGLTNMGGGMAAGLAGLAAIGGLFGLDSLPTTVMGPFRQLGGTVSNYREVTGYELSVEMIRRRAQAGRDPFRGLSPRAIEGQRGFRDTLMDSGSQWGFSPEETKGVAESLVSSTGAARDLNRELAGVFETARKLGITPQAMSQALATNIRTGGTLTAQQLGGIVSGGAKAGGMEGREEEFMRAVSSLTEATTKMTMKASDPQALAMSLSLLGAYSPALRGQEGVNLLQGMDASVRNTGDVVSNRMDYLAMKKVLGGGPLSYGKYRMEKTKGWDGSEINQDTWSEEFNQMLALYGGDVEFTSVMFADMKKQDPEKILALARSNQLGGTKQQRIGARNKANLAGVSNKMGQDAISSPEATAATLSKFDETLVKLGSDFKWLGEQATAAAGGLGEIANVFVGMPTIGSIGHSAVQTVQAASGSVEGAATLGLDAAGAALNPVSWLLGQIGAYGGRKHHGGTLSGREGIATLLGGEMVLPAQDTQRFTPEDFASALADALVRKLQQDPLKVKNVDDVNSGPYGNAHSGTPLGTITVTNAGATTDPMGNTVTATAANSIGGGGVGDGGMIQHTSGVDLTPAQFRLGTAEGTHLDEVGLGDWDMAACGPIMAYGALKAAGLTKGEDFKTFAKKAHDSGDWAAAGMSWGNVQALGKKYGMDVHSNVSQEDMYNAVKSGGLGMLDVPAGGNWHGHWMLAQDVRTNPDTGEVEYYWGNTAGTALKALTGHPWASLAAVSRATGMPVSSFSYGIPYASGGGGTGRSGARGGDAGTIGTARARPNGAIGNSEGQVAGKGGNVTEAQRKALFFQKIAPLAQYWSSQTGIPMEMFMGLAAEESNWGNTTDYALFGEGTADPNQRAHGMGFTGDIYLRGFPDANRAFEAFALNLMSDRYAAGLSKYKQDHNLRAYIDYIRKQGYLAQNDLNSTGNAIESNGYAHWTNMIADIGIPAVQSLPAHHLGTRRAAYGLAMLRGGETVLTPQEAEAQAQVSRDMTASGGAITVKFAPLEVRVKTDHGEYKTHAYPYVDSNDLTRGVESMATR